MIYSAPLACRHYISSRINSGFLLWQIIDGRLNCDGGIFAIDFHLQPPVFCAAPHKNSLVVVFNHEIFEFQKAWKLFSSFMIHDGNKNITLTCFHETWPRYFCLPLSLSHFSFHLFDSEVINHIWKTVFSSCVSFVLWWSANSIKFTDFQIVCSTNQTIKKLFSSMHRSLRYFEFQGGHVTECKQISLSISNLPTSRERLSNEDIFIRINYTRHVSRQMTWGKRWQIWFKILLIVFLCPSAFNPCLKNLFFETNTVSKITEVLNAIDQ